MASTPNAAATVASARHSHLSHPVQAQNGQGRPKRPHDANGNSKPWKQKKTKREKNITEGSSEEVLRRDIEALLASRGFTTDPEETSGTTQESGLLPEQGTETEVEVLELSSTGDGLAMRSGSNQVYVVPFTVPGDVAKVKVFRHIPREHQTVADFISIVKPSSLRDDARIQCKRRVLEKAYRNFSNLPSELVPAIQDTIGSPLQYGYRTKLTPHFDGPPGFRPSKRKAAKVSFESCPDIGFMQKGKRKVLDIEDCPIGTSAVRLGMARERERMQSEFRNYHRGATILLRENTHRYPKDSQDGDQPPKEDALPPYTARTEGDDFIDIKTCETDSKATTTEFIGNHTFTNPAGSFFQNNNSILPKFTAYVREHILPPPSNSPIRYLIDAYSGSGLFTITLSSVFQHSTGIDIAADSIASARNNASLNGLGEDRCQFIAADAGELFKSVTYPADETVVVLDPPRKGCDADFLGQLRTFGPKRILYVSCNVHTQARDVGILVRAEGDGARYDIESLVGFDFFPQTGHVEGVAILNRCDQPTTENGGTEKDP
ncbi:tRNA(m5U54)methyltransferase [Metarhizium acridum]|uniref:tRNA(m5U54)methyltransferase n=1 Tax=Metarhizium acridum TaxID=92637 RepID=UPI001C6C2CE7|nr:tRNA(m5U54)methyltransferase [Metarhizium acridum]